MTKYKVKFLCHFCNLIVISEYETTEDAFLHHIQTCIWIDKTREKLEQ